MRFTTKTATGREWELSPPPGDPRGHRAPVGTRLPIHQRCLSECFHSRLVPTPIDLDGAVFICPSPVPHDVQRQCALMGTYACNPRDTIPGQMAFPQVDGLLH